MVSHTQFFTTMRLCDYERLSGFPLASAKVFPSLSSNVPIDVDHWPEIC